MSKKRKRDQRSLNVGQVQLEVLRYVADHHPISVSDVAAYFAETQGKARTTILTVMEKLREKGYLSRRKHKGTYHYSPKTAKDKIMSNVIGNFVDRALGGSISPLIAYLSDTRELSDAELHELKKMVKELPASNPRRSRKRGDS